MRYTYRRNTDRKNAFTLIELLTVISLIVLLLVMVVPTAMTLMNAGAEAQAANIMTAQLTVARTAAVEKSAYVGLRVALSERKLVNSSGVVKFDKTHQTTFAALVWDNPATTDHNFTTLSEGGNKAEYKSHAMPKPIAFGEISQDFITSTNDEATPAYYKSFEDFSAVPPSDGVDNINSAMDYLNHFTSFTVLFAPDGQVTEGVPGEEDGSGNPLIRYKSGGDGILFGDNPGINVQAGDDKMNNFLWLPPTRPEPGVFTMTIFDYQKVYGLMQAAQNDSANSSKHYNLIKQYLDIDGSFMSLNCYTGHLLPRR